MSTEVIVLVLTTIAGVIKAYFEMNKAKAEAKRADEMEDMVRLLVNKDERAALPPDKKTAFVQKVKETTQREALTEEQLNSLIGEALK